jgi:hypothetical protein
MGRFLIEWTTEHLRLSLLGTPWVEGLVWGGLLGGIAPLLGVAAWAMGWPDGLKVALFLTPAVPFMAWFCHRYSRVQRKFAVEAFLTGERSVWLRDYGQPIMIPATEITRFEVTEMAETLEESPQPRTVYGIRAKCPQGDRDLLPNLVGTTRKGSEILCDVLNAFVLHRGSTNAALARVYQVQTLERNMIGVLTVALVGLGAWLFWFFHHRH